MTKLFKPESARDLIVHNEGYRPTVYKCTAGYDTIGYGFAIKDLFFSKKFFNSILNEKIIEIELKLHQNKCDWYKELPEQAQWVVQDLIYNIGFSGFFKFKKTIKYLKKHDFKGASEELLDSKYARKDVPNRAKRNSEILFNIGD